MTDTIKIPRPKFTRSAHGPKGRVEHDSRGNAVWVRSRAEDPADIAGPPLSIEESPAVDKSYAEMGKSKPGDQKRRR